MSPFKLGFRAILPLVSGIIPFGAVMGSAFAEAKLPFWQAMLMNLSVYAGAAQLATVDLMSLKAAVLVVVGTGLIINLRFLLYSAAMSHYLKESSLLVRFLTAFTLTDQSYAAMMSHHDKYRSNHEATQFYLGTAACMMLVWTSSVVAGYIFGNFAPAALNLDFAVPLSFVALLIPTLKTKAHWAVALASCVLSVLLVGLPLRSGLMVTAILCILGAWLMIRWRSR